MNYKWIKSLGHAFSNKTTSIPLKMRFRFNCSDLLLPQPRSQLFWILLFWCNLSLLWFYSFKFILILNFQKNETNCVQKEGKTRQRTRAAATWTAELAKVESEGFSPGGCWRAQPATSTRFLLSFSFHLWRRSAVLAPANRYLRSGRGGMWWGRCRCRRDLWTSADPRDANGLAAYYKGLWALLNAVGAHVSAQIPASAARGRLLKSPDARKLLPVESGPKSAQPAAPAAEITENASLSLFALLFILKTKKIRRFRASSTLACNLARSNDPRPLSLLLSLLLQLY